MRNAERGMWNLAAQVRTGSGSDCRECGTRSAERGIRRHQSEPGAVATGSKVGIAECGVRNAESGGTSQNRER